MRKSNVKKNYIYQVMYDILILLTPFLTSPYISRVIGAEGLGKYSYSYSVAFYFVLFANLGINNYGNRAIAQNRDDRNKLNSVFSSILAVHVGVSVVVFFGYLIYIASLAEDRSLGIIQGLYVFSALLDISWFYFGLEQFKLPVARSSIIKLLTVALIFIFVKRFDDLWIYTLIMAGGIFISQLVLWIPLKKNVTIVQTTWQEKVVHMKPMVFLFLPAIAVSLYKYMDKIMIGAISSKMQLGFYENAEKVNNMPGVFVVSFGTVMLPKMSNLAAQKDRKNMLRFTSLSMQFVLLLSIGMAFGEAAIAEVFAPLFWGEEFVLSGKLIMGLAITLPFISFANVIRTQYLIPNHRDKDYLISTITGAIVNLLMNAILIPKYGAWGATVGTICAEVSVCIVQTCAVRKELPIIKYMVSALPYLCFGTIMFFVVYNFGKIQGEGIKTLLLQVLIGVTIYGILVLIYCLVTRNELAKMILDKRTKNN